MNTRSAKWKIINISSVHLFILCWYFILSSKLSSGVLYQSFRKILSERDNLFTDTYIVFLPFLCYLCSTDGGIYATVSKFFWQLFKSALLLLNIVKPFCIVFLWSGFPFHSGFICRYNQAIYLLKLQFWYFWIMMYIQYKETYEEKRRNILTSSTVLSLLI